jgi:hypothetical protein
MDKLLAIYVSAAHEMDAECELLGQMLAGLTPAVRWVVRRTPTHTGAANPDLEALRSSQFYLLLLGRDIVAPMGVEWMAARDAHLSAYAYRSASAIPSPAATAFARNAGASWVSYASPLDLRRQVERTLIETLIQGTPGYGLDLADIEALAARLRQLEGEPPGPESEERRGAGRGGVILART